MSGLTTSISLTFIAVGAMFLGAAAADRVPPERRDLLALIGNVAAVTGALGALVGVVLDGTAVAEVVVGIVLGVVCITILVFLLRRKRVRAVILRLRGRRHRERQHNAEPAPMPADTPRPAADKRGLPPAWGPSPAAAVETEWWRTNALALLALSPVVVAALRVIFFSRGDPALLSILGRSLDVPGVLLAGVVPLLGLALSYALFVVIANRHLTPGAGRWLIGLRPLPATLLMVAVGVALVTTPARDVPFLILLPVTGIAYRLIANRADRRTGRYVPADIPAIVAIAVIVVLQSAGPWMPEESVTFVDGSQATAYVLRAEDGWVTLVAAEDREVSRVRAGQIESREVCGSPRSRTLLHLVFGAEPQPACPDRGDDADEPGALASAAD